MSVGMVNRGRVLAVWSLTLSLAGLIAPSSYAQTGTLPLDSYLHGSGGTTNPPILTLDLLPSISLTAKTKDSPALNFSGGNPWQVLGSWIPPSGSTGAFTITAVGPTHLWTGLKASGDVGGKIDLLTEVLVNGSVISSGLTRCVSGLTASALTPQDVTVALGTIPVTPITPATQTLALRVSARMGTTAANAACGTKTSVTGVRVYFDSLLRLSRVNVTFQTPPPSPVALIPNPFSIKAGTTANLIAILFPVPLQATSLAVISTSPGIATVPATVPVAAGQLFVSVPVTGVSAGATQVAVTLNSKSVYSTVKVTGGVATVTSLTPPALSITQGGTGTLTVTLNAVQSTNTTVSLTGSAASVASVPASVIVPAGQLSAPVSVAANTAGQADITASLNGTSATSHITVTAALPTVVALQPATSQVVLGASSTLTVTISSAQPTNTTVTLTATPMGILTVPPTVIVPANQTQGTFSVTGLALGTAMVTASLNSSSATAAVDVIPPALQLTALQPPTQSIVVNATGSLTVSINAQQTAPTTIALTVDNAAVLTIPATVTVQPNQLTATFTVIGNATGLATLTATLGTVTKTATVTVTPQPPQVAALLPPTLNVIQGATGSLTLSINAAQVGDTPVPLTNSNATILDVPPSVIVPSGLTSVSIPVAGLTLGSATVTATLNGTVSSTITVVPPPALVTALGPVPPTPAPLTLAKGRAGVLQVTLSRVPTDPIVVSLTNANTNLVTIPSTVTVQAGQLTAQFPVTTQNEGTASITASLNGSSQAAQVVVIAAEVDQVTVTPSNPTAFAGDSLAFTATAIMTDGTTQPLTTGVTWASTNPAVATISNTGLATTLTAGTTIIRASTTNALGPVTGETTLTVQTPPQLTLVPATANLLVGQSVTLTVTSAAPAPVGGLSVSFAFTGPGAVTFNPLSLLIPAGQASGTVQVTATGAGTTTVTASAPSRLPGTSILTITNPVPTLATLTPTQITAAGPPFTLTVTGTNFVSTTVVKFDGAVLTTTFVSATQLTALVPTSAIGAAHAASVIVSTPTPGGGNSAALVLTVVNPVPVLTTISPSQVLTGSAAFILSVNGSNFVSTSVVTLDGQTLVTAFVSATQLTAQVPATALTPARAAPVTVTNPAPGGGASNQLLLIINTPPIANAGRPQSATVGAAVTLDGRNSLDVDHDPLTFSWVFVSRPAGSTATLLNPTTVRSGFTPDVPGLYLVQLDVNDGKVLSAPAVVTVTAVPANSPANAEPGPNRAALIGQPAALDGRLSTDPDNDQLRYTWAILSAPVGSAAALTNATSVLASLTPDLAGDYIVNLVVNDGTADSAPVAVKITATSANAAPLANAGRDLNVLANTLVTLDGSGSRDPNNGTTLTYNWAFLSAPAGSTAVLTNPTTVSPTFTPTVTGDYLVRLIVNDGLLDSAPSVLLITVASPNAAPNANAGADQTVAQTELVTLNGTASSDPNGDSLTFQWSLVSVPTGSTATLVNPTAAQPTFVADQAGFYVVRLIVTDSTLLSSAPAVIVIKAQAVTALAVTPVNPTITIGQTQAFVATATLADNSTKDLTNRVTWVSSNAAVATINANGLATSVGPGTTVITATAGTVTSPAQILHVVPFVPTITGFTPASGTVGTVVTMTGTNFTNVAQGGLTVRFNGTAAVASSVTPTSITTTVPLGATTGNITVQTAGGTATSTTPFTVTLSADFQMSTGPTTITAVQGRGATTIIQMTNAPTSFASLVNLVATGLPAGTTAVFSAPVLSLNQPVTLTLNTNGTTPTGTVPVTLTGTTTIDGKTITRTTTVNLSVIASGTTTFSGRVLRSQDAVPLQGATIKLGTQQVTTDASGRYFFTTAPVGTQLLTIDGSTVTNPPGIYHLVPFEVTVAANQPNELPFISYLPVVDTSVISTIDPSRSSVIQDPRIPGYSLTIPAGVELRSDVDGSLITQVSITAVSPDRLPMPAPNAGLHIDPAVVYMLYFGKPGGAIPSAPISQFTMPNDLGSAPGRQMIFYHYVTGPLGQAGASQWRLAGSGKVSADGKTVHPDPGVAITKFCCDARFVCNGAGATNKNPGGDGNTGGDPIDLSTGQFLLRKTDLVLPGRLPLVIDRSYQSGKVNLPGPFGRGTNFSYEIQAQDTETAQIITYTQANGRTDLLSLQPDGTYQNTQFPFLRGSVLTKQADGSRIMRHKDGRIERYSTGGRVVALEDRNGNTVTIERNTNNVITRIVEPSGRALTVGTNAGGRITSIQDPLGREVRYTYTPDDLLETVTDQAGGITRYTYDAAGNLLTITDARGILYLTNEYDTEGRVIRQTLADSGLYTLSYQTFGTTIVGTTVTDPRGKTTTSRFNAQGYTGSTTDGVGQLVRKTLDQSNQMTETRDAQNRVTKYTYDSAGNVTSILDTQGNAALFEYEATFNKVTKITDALNQNTRFTYDPATGNLLSTTDPLLHATAISYNPFGQPVSVQGPIPTEPPTTFEYNEVGDLIATVDPLGNRTLRFYDAVSRLIAIVDPRGKSTQFTYDNLNRITQIQDAINGLTAFTYDPNGNLLTVTDAKNQTTTYTYDNMDRLVTRKDALNRTESYQYDVAGNLTQFTDRKGQVTTFSYDSLNRRIGANYADATTTFTYDAVGRLTKASDTAPGSGAIDFAYDVLDRLIQETTEQGSVAYQYDVLGRRTQMTANGQQSVAYQYDAASRLTRVEQGSLFAALGYDDANRRTSLGYSNGTTASYAYDLASRLTSITHNGPSGVIDALIYTYDAAGNRTSLLRANGTASLLPLATGLASYDAANEQTAFAGVALQYDANGNLTNDGVNSYQWDARNRLVTITGGTNASFAYDPLGRRTAKTINSVASQFLYDGNDIAAEVGGGAIGASYLRSLSIDEPFIRQTGTSNEHYHTDALGSSLVLSDTTGGSLAGYRYEPFGNNAVTGSSVNQFQFTGRENDGTGLYYYRTRYYSPSIQRFLAEDPLGFGGGDSNLYNYTLKNPINYIDPTGLAAKCPDCFENCLQANYGNYANYAFNTSAFGLLSTTGLAIAATSVGIKLGVGIGIGGSAQVAANTYAAKATNILSTPASAFGSIFNYQVRASLAASAAQTSALFSNIASYTYSTLTKLSVAGTAVTIGASTFYATAWSYCQYQCRGK